MKDNAILNKPLFSLLQDHAYLRDFFNALSISLPRENVSLKSFISSQPLDHLSTFGMDHGALSSQVKAFIARMEAFKGRQETTLKKVTIKAGFDKSGTKEPMDVDLIPGQVVSVVGPTGSGKSRLLADIECLAQEDTPSRRRIFLDGKVPDEKKRFSGDGQMVAQLSQNMNFVIDLTVAAFLEMHGQSRLVDDIDARIVRIFGAAKGLAGEPFDLDTPVTALSGGQSRALMIADVAFLSACPIVLIDEIENAGVDRQEALKLLVKEEKIVLMATHDPLLALSGDRRMVIRNGGIVDVMDTSPSEQEGAAGLMKVDKKLALLRENVRCGRRLDFDWDRFFKDLGS